MGASAARRQRHGQALARAFRWRRMLDEGAHATLEDLARAKGVDATYVSRVLRLTLLAPEIVQVILDRRQPAEMQVDDLLAGFPLERAHQRERSAISAPHQPWRFRCADRLLRRTTVWIILGTWPRGTGKGGHCRAPRCRRGTTLISAAGAARSARARSACRTTRAPDLRRLRSDASPGLSDGRVPAGIVVKRH